MKFTIPLGTLLIATLSTTLCHGQSSREGAPEELKQLPMVALDRKGEFPADFRVIPGASDSLHKYGFAFRTPPLIEGPATWLVVWDHEKPDASTWQVTFADGRSLAVVAPVLDDLSLYPELAKKFPAGKSVQRLRVEQHRLNKWDRYQAVLTTPANTPPLGIVINAAAGGIVKLDGGEAREVSIPEGWIPSGMVMELTENIRAVKGEDAAIEFLEAQFARKAGRLSEYEILFSKVWNEAQFGGGLDSPGWGSRLNDAAFTSALRIGHYSRAFDILNNLGIRLDHSGRFGRLAEVHAILEDAYRKGGLNMDSGTYPDLGSAIPCLPSIRHRDIPVSLPYSKELPPGPPPISRVASFPMGALLNYAHQSLNSSDWQGGFEWTVWVRDWALDDQGNIIQSRNEIWYYATFNIALQLESMGFIDEALALVEEAVSAPFGLNYRQSNKITASRLQLHLRRKAGRPDPETIPKLRALIARIADHIHLGRSNVWIAKNNLAEALFDAGEFAEGDRIIEEIIREGSYYARWTRLDRWLETGRTEGVEAELIDMLRSSRESGRKISELGLYSRYAEFLEKTGRVQESLAMRREAIRLARDFNAFTKLPVELAKLAALLHKLGHSDLAAAAADEARGLLKARNMPPSTVKSVTECLDGMGSPAAAPPQAPRPQRLAIDLQPHRGLVIPLEGAPWASYLTLANPGTAEVRGSLEIFGAPMVAKADEESGDILINLPNAKGDGRSVLPLTLAPGSFRLITVAADAGNAGKFELKFAWLATAGETGDEARITIDEREQGVAGAIIQAGDYQANPFYGVPIYLSYVAKDRRAKSSPLRFRGSQVTRIEISRLDGTPLAVDSTGNGSLLDPGDELFSETDGAGNLLLGLADGSAALQILAYPEGGIGADGLRIDVEVFDGGEWSLHSTNRIER